MNKNMSWCLLMPVCDHDSCHWPVHISNWGQNFVNKERSKPAKPFLLPEWLSGWNYTFGYFAQWEKKIVSGSGMLAMLFTQKVKLGLLVISANLSVIKWKVCPVQYFCSMTVKKCLYLKHHTIKHLKGNHHNVYKNTAWYISLWTNLQYNVDSRSDIFYQIVLACVTTLNIDQQDLHHLRNVTSSIIVLFKKV